MEIWFFIFLIKEGSKWNFSGIKVTIIASTNYFVYLTCLNHIHSTYFHYIFLPGLPCTLCSGSMPPLQGGLSPCLKTTAQKDSLESSFISRNISQRASWQWAERNVKRFIWNIGSVGALISLHWPQNWPISDVVAFGRAQLQLQTRSQDPT